MVSDVLLAAVMQIASLFVIACCIFLVSSLIAGSTFLAHRKYLSALHYRIKNKYLVLHALSAVCASIVVTVWLSLPNSQRLPFVFKHCHSSNCATHIPAIIDFTLLNLLFAFFVIGMVTVCFILIKAHQNKLEQRINSLLRLSHNKYLDNNYRLQASIISVSQPVLLNVGMITPKLLLSSQIAEFLDVKDVKLLLAYEYAKAKQFENFKVKLVQIACLFWPASVRRLIITDLLAVLRDRALNEVHQLFGGQKTTIPKTILNEMSKDIQEFLLKIERNTDHLPQSADVIVGDANLTATAYLASFSYFLLLVVVTSNFTHFLFELIG
jgi:hypothetical protein